MGTDGQVLAADSTQTLGVKWATPGLVVYPRAFDKPPASAHADDDEFEGTSLDAKWTNPLTSTRTNTIALLGGWVFIEPSESGSSSIGKGGNGIRQAAPTGSFTVTAYIADNAPANDDGRIGILIARTASNKGHIVGPYRAANFQASAISFTYSESADFGAYDSGVNQNSGTGYAGPGYYQVIWNSGAGTLTCKYSTDGLFWTTLTTVSGQSQPDRIGLALWSNSTTLRADHSLACGLFRVTEP